MYVHKKLCWYTSPGFGKMEHDMQCHVYSYSLIIQAVSLSAAPASAATTFAITTSESA